METKLSVHHFVNDVSGRVTGPAAYLEYAALKSCASATGATSVAGVEESVLDMVRICFFYDLYSKVQ